MDLPEVVSASEWEEAQKRLRSKEKELTGRSDDLAAERRRLPRTRVEKGYEFHRGRSASRTCSRAAASSSSTTSCSGQTRTARASR